MANVKTKRKLGTIVKVSNDLARAHLSTESVWEIRVISAIASLVKNSDEEFHTYRIPLASLGHNSTLGRNYEDIRKAIHTLAKKSVEVRGEGNNFRVYSIFAMCGIEDGELIAGFHPDLKPLFLDLKERFTLYQAKEIMKLPSIYSQKMFMLLKSWARCAEVTISLIELHKLLDVPQSFKKQFINFRRRVLEQAYEDINKLTSLRFEWKPIKNGRAIAAIRFIFFSDIANAFVADIANEEIILFQAKSNKCFEKLQRMGKDCVPRPRSKTCRYCQDRGRMHSRNLMESSKVSKDL